MSKKHLTFIDMFAGIGGFHSGMEQAGHRCVGWIEWDKFARQSYKALYNTDGIYNAKDIQNVKGKDLPKADVWCFGSPCQNLSVAGKRAGINGSQSSMFFEVMRLLGEVEVKPNTLVMENVKGLLSSHKGADFEIVKDEFNKHGYDIEYEVLNSKNVVPQNRERIYIVGHLKGPKYDPVFPISDNDLSQYRQHKYLSEILDSSVDSSFYLDLDKLVQLIENDKKHTFRPSTDLKVVGNVMKSNFYNGRVYNPAEGIAPILTTMKGGNRQPKVLEVYATITPDRVHKRQNGRRFKLNNEPSFTITRSDKHGIAIKYLNMPDKNIPAIELDDHTYLAIRKLTPKECWFLQGFSKDQFNKAQQAGVSNSQLYAQAGNAVTVPVVKAIAERLSIDK